MHLAQQMKRMGLAFAVSIVMLALCATYIDRSRCGYATRTDSVRATMHLAGRANSHPAHGKHPMPWFEVAVTRAIYITSYLAA
jgi:hypothetical protein